MAFPIEVASEALAPISHGLSADNEAVRLWHTILASLWQMAAGALAGALAGYLSHLALDATTPKGLPLVA